MHTTSTALLSLVALCLSFLTAHCALTLAGAVEGSTGISHDLSKIEGRLSGGMGVGPEEAPIIFNMAGQGGVDASGESSFFGLAFGLKTLVHIDDLYLSPTAEVGIAGSDAYRSQGDDDGSTGQAGLRLGVGYALDREGLHNIEVELSTTLILGGDPSVWWMGAAIGYRTYLFTRMPSRL